MTKTVSTDVSVTKLHVMSRRQQYCFWLFASVGVMLTATFAAVWFDPDRLPDNFTGYGNIFDGILFILVSYVIWHQIIAELVAWFIMAHMRKPRYMRPQRGLKVAFISTFVPGKEPYDMLERNIKGMVAADYPHDTWILDEGDDPVAKALCESYGVKHFSRFGIEAYNQMEGPFKAKTKGGNHNAWYDSVGKQYDIVAQIDLDFLPSKKFLTRTLGYFRDPRVAFVGTPQVYGNGAESSIAQGAAEQTFGFYGPIEKGLFGHDMTMMVGANHVVRVKALKDIDWYAGHLTEDLLTGMQLYAQQWKSVYVPEVLAVGEGPTTWDAYFKQQMRWAHGCIHILFFHSFALFKSMRRHHRFIYFMMQQHYFSGLTLVLGIGLLSLYFVFGVQSVSMDVMPMLSTYVPLLLWQFAFVSWMQRYNISPKTESGLQLRGKMVIIAATPIYFLALLGVLRGKHLSFKVTPKGEGNLAITPLSLFKPHFILGTTTLVGMVVGLLLGHTSGVLMFWACTNSILMYGIVAKVGLENMKAWYAMRRAGVGTEEPSV